MLGILGAVAPLIKTLFKTIDKTIENKADAERIKQSIQQQLLYCSRIQRRYTSKKLEASVNDYFCRFNCSALVWLYCS